MLFNKKHSRTQQLSSVLGILLRVGPRVWSTGNPPVEMQHIFYG